MDSGYSPTVGQLLRQARGRVDAADAELLLAHALGRSRGWLFAHDDAVPASGAAAGFEALVARRAGGEPVAYLTGSRGFWRFDLAVTPDTLIPRPETELLVEAALDKLDDAPGQSAADLGTGSGAIALALAHERPQARILATDRSPGALAVARGNAAALGIGSIEFREGDWFAPLHAERFDLIASNPPYIAAEDAHLSDGDLRFEPRTALTPGGDGLAAIRTLVAGASAHLLRGGWLLLEHGWDQGPAVRALMAAEGYADVATLRDLGGRERVTLGRSGGPLAG